MKFLLWMTVPFCKTCIHYLPPIDGRFDSNRALCKRISTIDVVEGTIEYSLASDVRTHPCNGTLYVPEPNLPIKMLQHEGKRYAIYAGYIVLYLSLFICTKIR